MVMPKCDYSPGWLFAGPGADLVEYGHHITRALAIHHSWGNYDVRGLTQAADDQQLRLNWDTFHALPALNDQMNDVLLNLLCPA